MEQHWYRQSSDVPLFPDLFWGRPETKSLAGKLLIVGGNKFSFAAVATAYTSAVKAGIGTARVLLPEALQKVVSKIFPEADFGPSTPSGSFSRQALATMLDLAKWADGVLLAGDFGRNSETAILLESFLEKYRGRSCLTGDSIDYFLQADSPILSRYKTVITIDISQLQKLARHNQPSTPVLYSMMLSEMVEMLHDWTTGIPAQIVTCHASNFIVASGGQVSSTPAKALDNWQTELGAYVSVWQIQQPAKPFEATVSAIYDFVSA